MKKSRVKTYLVLVGLVLMLCACKKEPTWQDQYDLGMKYLEEGNYEEAIAAFSAAIEIDAVPVEAHKELSNALYLSVGETGEQELNDNQKALCEQTRDAYLWLIESGNAGADEYIKAAEMDEKLGDLDAALEIINRGIENVENEKFNRKRRDLEIAVMEEKSYKAVVFKNEVDYPQGYWAWGIEILDPFEGIIDGESIQVSVTNLVYDPSNLVDGQQIVVKGYLMTLEELFNMVSADISSLLYPNGEYAFRITEIME